MLTLAAASNIVAPSSAETGSPSILHSTTGAVSDTGTVMDPRQIAAIP